MIGIQCTSCQTHYHIDERVLPDETPTFKCLRCGHVFTADPSRFKPVTESASSNQVVRPQAPAKAAKAAPDARESRRQYSPIRPLTAVKPAVASEPRPSARRAPQIAQENESAGSDPPPAAAEPPQSQPRNEGGPLDSREADASPQESVRAASRSLSSARRQAEGANAAERETASGSDERFDEPRFDDEDQAPGENLAFDFADDEPEIEVGEPPKEELKDETWEVGADEPAPDPEARFDEPDLRVSSSPAPPLREPVERGLRPGKRSVSASLKHQASGEVDRYLDRGKPHSAGFFVAMFFLIAIGFTGASLVICGAPVASERLLSRLPVIGPSLETAPALESMVALDNVHAYYEQLKGGHRALVIVGRATNGASTPLHVVQIEVRVLDASSRALATRSVYCGQTLSEQMIAQMTPHELEFLQKLLPQKTFVLDPTDTAPFVSVFIDPPANVSRFAVSVAKVTPASIQTASNQSRVP
jgi:predicted Zn finger-like uncharacterized protein